MRPALFNAGAFKALIADRMRGSPPGLRAGRNLCVNPSSKQGKGRSMLKRLVFIALLAVSGSAMASKDLSNIPLVWSPTQSFAEFGAIDLNGIGNVKVQFNGFTDVRKNPALIAENHEDDRVRQVT